MFVCVCTCVLESMCVCACMHNYVHCRYVFTSQIEQLVYIAQSWKWNGIWPVLLQWSNFLYTPPPSFLLSPPPSFLLPHPPPLPLCPPPSPLPPRLTASTPLQSPPRCLLGRSRSFRQTSSSRRSRSRWSPTRETTLWWWACSGGSCDSHMSIYYSHSTVPSHSNCISLYFTVVLWERQVM